jgi:type I restriction enzyme S subunit
MQNLPFLEVCSDASGGNLKVPKRDYSETGAIPIIDQGKQLIGGYTDDHLFSFRSADLPVVIFGDHTCCVKHASKPFAIGADGVKILKPKPEIDSKYLYHYLRKIQLTDGGYDRHFKYLKRIQIPIPFKDCKPDLAEQKRIAAILDKADGIRRKRREALQLADDFLRSYFLDMFGDPVTNPKGWKVEPLSNFVERLDGGKNIAEADEETSFRVLKVSAVTGGEYRPEKSKPVPESFQIPPSYLVNEGDLLISRANTRELIGATAFVWETPSNIMLPDKIWKFIWKDEARLHPLFAHAVTKAGSFRNEMSKRASGTSGSMKNIAKPKLLSLPIPVPPIDLQNHFAQCVKQHRKLRVKNLDLTDQANDFFASVQQRAFKGEL